MDRIKHTKHVATFLICLLDQFNEIGSTVEMLHITNLTSVPTSILSKRTPQTQRIIIYVYPNVNIPTFHTMKNGSTA